MAGMFRGCNGLNSLDLSNFDTRNVRYIRLIFKDCSSLRYLDLSSFNLCNLVSSYELETMFDGCDSLEKVIVPKDVKTREMLLEALEYSVGPTKYSSIDIT